jgi:hypothetical protein
MNAFVSEASDAKAEPGYRIPTNLCPYMRRFVRLSLATMFIATLAVMVAIMFIALPLAVFMLVPPLAMAGGALVWLALIGFILHRSYVKYGKHNVKYIKAQEATKAAFQKAWKPFGDRIDCSIFVAWYRAVHDKICPSLHFYDD